MPESNEIPTTPDPEVSEETPTPPVRNVPDARAILEEHIQKSKMQRKASMRAGILVVVLLGLGFAGYKFIPQIVNSDPGKFDSAGYLLAIKQNGEDGEIVMLNADGEKTEVPGHAAGVLDQSPAWSADGQRAFFVSDRDKKEPHIFRWNPKPGKLLGMFSRPSVERRSMDSRAKTQLTFSVPGGQVSKTALLVSGGTVLEFDPVSGETVQMLPPANLQKSAGGAEGEGRGGQFDAAYSKFGTGFLSARWMQNKSYIAATMRLEDGGMMLLQQNMVEAVPPQMFPLAGDQIDFDVDPESGALAITILNARYLDKDAVPPEAIKNGKAIAPFRHAVLMWTTSGDVRPVIASQDDKQCYSKPKISPGGLEKVGMMAILGPYDSANKTQKPEALFLMGPAAQTQGNMKGLARGKIYEAAWHPSGTSLAFSMYVDRYKKISICTMNLDGSNSKVLTGSEGDYRYPVYSPTFH